jgi:hypothetical protein
VIPAVAVADHRINHEAVKNFSASRDSRGEGNVMATLRMSLSRTKDLGLTPFDRILLEGRDTPVFASRTGA